MSSSRLGLLQMRSGVEPDANLAAISQAAQSAAEAGCALLLTPEASNLVQRDPVAQAETLRAWSEARTSAELSRIAKSAGLWLYVGSVMVPLADGRVANRALMFDANGVERARYDKIHLFDVRLSAGEVYSESASVAPGASAVVAETPIGRLGLSVCYDLRFASLYRALAQAGAQVLAVPAAFTRVTGKAHWEVLLRARAIETGAYVIAAAQGGVHEDGRSTFGRTMVVDPWGEVTAHLDHDDPGLLIAELDLARVADARGRIPSLLHDRDYRTPGPVEAGS